MKMIFLIVAAGSAVALAAFSMQPYMAHQAPSVVDCATANCAVDCATATCVVVPAALSVAPFPFEFTSEFVAAEPPVGELPEPVAACANAACAVECPSQNCAVSPAEPPVAEPVAACPGKGC